MSRSTVSDSADSSCLFALSEGRFGGLLSTGVYCGGHESADSCCTSYFSEGGLGASSVEDADLLALQLFHIKCVFIQPDRNPASRRHWTPESDLDLGHHVIRAISDSSFKDELESVVAVAIRHSTRNASYETRR